MFDIDSQFTSSTKPPDGRLMSSCRRARGRTTQLDSHEAFTRRAASFPRSFWTCQGCRATFQQLLFTAKKPPAAAYRRLPASAAAACPPAAAAAPRPAPRATRRHSERSARGGFWPRRAGGGSSSDRPSTAEDHRPPGQRDSEPEESGAAAVALFLPHADDVDAEYVRLVVSELVGKAGEEPGFLFLLLLLSMVQVGGAKHHRTEPNSWPALLACKQGGGSAPMRWVNFRLPHPERLSPPTSSSSTPRSSSSSSFPVSAKSMRFIWNNIFSKGSHMLQCLCGRSLKKNKNPTDCTVRLVAGVSLQSQLCSKWEHYREGKDGMGG
ncbi:unnamed protein product [Menidia menidia]|uniref:(Atlantic silverside) hypothetical protein n=1 Tax=Menidia menidia TaxID=238744 RepID=A0A8S4BD08_9TELE|nr:unnamed protein product [Menidia menidia]